MTHLLQFWHILFTLPALTMNILIVHLLIHLLFLTNSFAILSIISQHYSKSQYFYQIICTLKFEYGFPPQNIF